MKVLSSFSHSTNIDKQGVFLNNKLVLNLQSGFVSISYTDTESCELFHITCRNKNGKFFRVSNSSKVEDFETLNDIRRYILSNQEQIEFALFYEEATQEVFIFRNIFGLIPIYYFQIPEQRFSISTDLPDLVRHENTLSQIFVNYNWVKNYLDFNGSKSYSNETIYSNVKLINPGHSLKINPSHFEEELATQFELERFKKLHTVEDFGHEFQRLFENSVKKNIGNQQIISAELSGGLDSSSVCAMARKLFPDYQMHTFFMEVPGIVIDESSFASIVAANLNATHHVLQPKSKTLDLVRLHTSLYGYPDRMISGPSLVGTRLETVQDLGLSTLLSGHDGDDIVGMGLEYPEDLFDNREWDLLQTELNHRAVNYSFEKFYPLWDTFPANKKQQLHLEDFIFSQLGRRHKTNSKKELLQLVFELTTQFGISPMTKVIIRAIQREVKNNLTTKVQHSNIFTKDFADNKNINSFEKIKTLDSLVARVSKDLQCIDKYSIPDVFGGLSLTASEDFHALSNHYKVKEKFPFFDKELFELAISVPQQIKFDHGRLRGYMREGMKGILHEQVRTRVSKSKFSNFGRNQALLLCDEAVDLLNNSKTLWTIIDRQKFNDLVTILRGGKVHSNKITFLVLRTIFLAVWLDFYENQILRQP